MGEEVVFSFTISEPFELNNLPFYLLLGVFTGLVALYFTRMNMLVEHTLGKMKSPLVRTLTGGLVLSVLIFLMPHLFGEGYTTLKTLLSGHASELFNGTLFEGIIGNNASFIIVFFLLLIIFKVVAMAITTGSGGVGGIFAPALFVGGMSGAFLGKALNMFTPVTISENNFSLVGMAGVMAGVMHAPLTAIFLIAEITGGYALLIPLILTSTISYLTILTFEKQSIYTMRLAQRGELMTHHKDKAVLSMLSIEDVLEKDFRKVKADGNLSHLVKAISKSKRNIFPVVDEEKVLVGIIKLDDVRDIIFNTELYDKVEISELMHPPAAVISIDEKMERVLEIFEETESWNLPVTDNGHYIGFISRSNILTSYRKLLKEFSDD
jgi:CIC family chloride channel protein